MERPSDIDPKLSLAVWLRAGRAQKGMTLESVAKVTKIQTRTLERLEAGQLDGLPAEVFVRGFIRSFAKCVGLDEQEALQRYSAATGAAVAVAGVPDAEPVRTASAASAVAARAFVETMGGLAPAASARAGKELAGGSALDLRAEAILAAEMLEVARVEPMRADVEAAPLANGEDATPAKAIEVAAPAPAIGGRKKKRRGGKRAKRSTMAHGTPSTALPVVTPVDVVEAIASEPIGDHVVDAPALSERADEAVAIAEPWTPKMPTVVAPSVPWRRPHTSLFAAHGAPKVPVVPSLVIDDADPDGADREREERVDRVKEPGRRSFLPPILLDREDRTARQGGLTLAVIILLIAATLTLSYLMRRPSSSGDGVTLDESGQRDILAG